MKKIRFPYDEKRNNKYITYVDNVLCSCIIVCCVFQQTLGIPQMLQQQLGISESFAKLLVVVIAIILGAIEQFITYHIDKRIQK